MAATPASYNRRSGNMAARSASYSMIKGTMAAKPASYRMDVQRREESGRDERSGKDGWADGLQQNQVRIAEEGRMPTKSAS